MVGPQVSHIISQGRLFIDPNRKVAGSIVILHLPILILSTHGEDDAHTWLVIANGSDLVRWATRVSTL